MASARQPMENPFVAHALNASAQLFCCYSQLLAVGRHNTHCHRKYGQHNVVTSASRLCRVVGTHLRATDEDEFGGDVDELSSNNQVTAQRPHVQRYTYTRTRTHTHIQSAAADCVNVQYGVWHVVVIAVVLRCCYNCCQQLANVAVASRPVIPSVVIKCQLNNNCDCRRVTVSL